MMMTARWHLLSVANTNTKSYKLPECCPLEMKSHVVEKATIISLFVTLLVYVTYVFFFLPVSLFVNQILSPPSEME